MNQRSGHISIFLMNFSMLLFLTCFSLVHFNMIWWNNNKMLILNQKKSSCFLVHFRNKIANMAQCYVKHELVENCSILW